ncbi:MAG: 30S ribosomal protein S8 [Lentisphaerae bacterium]|nr:30S ribosomal protein S8 [Lentisphaerota bacterium]
MSQTDPIADMLVRMRNAQMSQKDVVDIPHSRIKGDIAVILRREGFIRDFVVEGGGAHRTLRLFLKYAAGHVPVITGMRRASKPGRRLYVGADDIPRVLGGMGVSILSTSSGLLSDKDARKRRVGGELLCSIW